MTLYLDKLLLFLNVYKIDLFHFIAKYIILNNVCILGLKLLLIYEIIFPSLYLSYKG